MHHMPRWMLLSACLLVPLAACQGDRAPASTPEVAVPDPLLEQSIHESRARRLAELTSADGWTSLVGLHWIEPGPHYVGSGPRNGIRLAMGPADLGMLERRGDAVLLHPDAGASLTLDGLAAGTGVVALRSDADAAGATVVGFDGGQGIATLIKRGDRIGLRVKHAGAATRTGFAGLRYWPADARWRKQARFRAHPPGRTMMIANIIGTVDAVPNPGIVEFEDAGRTFQLEALAEGDGLFLVFADQTSGHDSYGAGRFLDAPGPDGQGRLVLDLNLAYNPPCAFTAFATCPLPPAGNRLDLAVTAGEKTYVAQH